MRALVFFRSVATIVAGRRGEIRNEVYPSLPNA